MATAEDIVTRAMRRLQALDINERPSAAEMTHGLACLSELVNAWSMDLPEIAVQTMTATVTVDDETITVDDTTTLAEGLNLSGTGIPTGAYIVSIDENIKTSFEMSAVATATGADVDLTFTPIPFPVKYEGGVVALLAMRIKGDLGISLPADVYADLRADAADGWARLTGGYWRDKKAELDRSLARPPGTFEINTDVLT